MDWHLPSNCGVNNRSHSNEEDVFGPKLENRNERWAAQSGFGPVAGVKITPHIPASSHKRWAPVGEVGPQKRALVWWHSNPMLGRAAELGTAAFRCDNKSWKFAVQSSLRTQGKAAG